MVEYILLVALIALAVIGAVTFLANQSSSKFQNAGNQIKAAGTSAATCFPGDEVMTTYANGNVLCRGPVNGVYTAVP